MRLTAFSDYCLRVLIYLALHRGERVTIADIAAAYEISANHLMKVVHLLATAGYVSSTRGKGGGLALAKDPAEIRLGALTRETEAGDQPAECFDAERNRCRITPACALKGMLYEAVQAFYATLDRHTLADVVRQPEQLRAMLGSVPDGGAVVAGPLPRQ